MAMGVGSGANQFQLWPELWLSFMPFMLKCVELMGVLFSMQVIGLLVWLRRILLAQRFTMFSIM